MDIYFFTLVSTQIADPASLAPARVTGTVPQGACFGELGAPRWQTASERAAQVLKTQY